MKIPDYAADLLEKIREWADESLHGERDLTDAMWDISEAVSEFLKKEYDDQM